MSRRLGPVLLLAALASCGAASTENSSKGGESVAALTLGSTDLGEGQPIPVVHSCDGADQPPALSWGNPPAGTKSFALVMEDPDAPGGTFRHWGVFDVPANARSVPPAIGKQAINDFGKRGYGGPCPPNGHGPHHYRFKLFALDVDTLALPADANVEDLEAEALRHEIGLGQLTATYERK